MSLEDIENMPILDKETAITQLGDSSLFDVMLTSFEEMSMRTNLTDLKIALEKVDYINIRLSSHSLKGAASYIHAERVKTATSLLQSVIDNKKYDEISKHYLVLIKQCILLKRRIRYETCIKEEKSFNDDESDFDIPIAKNFNVIKHSATDFYIVEVSSTGSDFKISNRETKEHATISPQEKTKSKKIPDSTKKPNSQIPEIMEIEMAEPQKIACCNCNIV